MVTMTRRLACTNNISLRFRTCCDCRDFVANVFLYNCLKDWGIILRLAFQSIGVVYGDIGTSPLYVFASTFTDGIKHNDDILGVLSLIFYTITLIPVIKYVTIVLRANDNGEGMLFSSPFDKQPY